LDTEVDGSLAAVVDDVDDDEAYGGTIVLGRDVVVVVFVFVVVVVTKA
jgi:hypothetical protein